MAPSRTTRRPALYAQAPAPRAPGGRRADSLVLGRGLTKPSTTFSPVSVIPKRDHHAVLGEGLPIEDEGDDVVGAQVSRSWRAWSCLALAWMKRRETVEALKPKAARHGLRRGRVVPAAQPEEHLAEEPGIGGPRRLEGVVALQGDFPVLDTVPDAGVRDRELLIRQVDRAPLLAPADAPGLAAGALMAGAREVPDFALPGGLGPPRGRWGIKAWMRATFASRSSTTGASPSPRSPMSFTLPGSVTRNTLFMERLLVVWGGVVSGETH